MALQRNPSSRGSIRIEDHDLLDSIPSPQEIKDIIFSFKLYKALGPDGPQPFFYQKYWGTLSYVVTQFCMNTFTSSHLEPKVNTNYFSHP